MNERTLTVKGIGTVKTAPDLIVITIDLTTTSFDYAKSVELAAKNIDAIRRALIAAGHAGQALKTTDFSIRTERERYTDSAGNWGEKFKGYSCIHELKLEFELDMKLLGKTIEAISSSKTNPKLQISFSIMNKNAVQTELLENAVANAAAKAAILAKASGVSLGAIKHINYSWGEVRLYSETKFSEVAILGEPASAMNFEPEDVEANDTVTVIWDIQ